MGPKNKLKGLRITVNLTKSQVLSLRQDLSQFLFHLTRTGSVTERKDVFPHLAQDRKIFDTAKNRLEQILVSKRISAISPFGYFHYKVRMLSRYGQYLNPSSQVQRQWLKAVCFTETPLDHIQIQMQPIFGRTLKFESYGLAFKEDFLRSKGATPVMYFDSNNQSIISSLNDMAVSNDASKFKSMMPLYESFGPRLYGGAGEVDFRWEREWRALDDVIFTLSDVAFGICKSSDVSYFTKLVGNAFPFIDPIGNPQQIQQVKNYLRTYPHLADLK